jgi:diguanylate cyclase (GGDEF)-like protein/PAS domain S-box-containing protein
VRHWYRPTAVMASSVAATAAGLFYLGFSPWSDSGRAEFLSLLFTVGIITVLEARQPSPRGDTTMSLPFLAEVIALLLFGPRAMLVVAVVIAAARAFADVPRLSSARRIVLDIIAAAVIAQAAGLTHSLLGGTTVPLTWPKQVLPLAATVLVYCTATRVFADLLVTQLTGGTIARLSPQTLFAGCPDHLVGAAVAVALAEALHRRAWPVLLVSALPLCFGARAYTRHAAWLARLRRGRHQIASSSLGMCIVDGAGRITLWNQSVAEMLECLPEQATGRLLTEAAPLLVHSELPALVTTCLSARQPHTIERLRLRATAAARVLHVTVLPDPDGVMLLWRDITEQTQREETLRRNVDRFALVAHGSKDGCWELDERRQVLYLSSRWRAIVGLDANETSGAPEEWFGRVHPDDRLGLKRALEKHVTEQADHVEYEHRIRHEDGSYRRVLSRSAAVRDTSRHTIRIAGSLTDVTDSADTRDRLLSVGLHDSLTGLPNRAAFVDGLGRRLTDLKERRGGQFAVLYVDLDRFKIINDSLGHLVGDELLVAVSRRLEGCLRPDDAIARLGGDEFAILLQGLADEPQANVVAFRIQDALSHPFSVGGREVVTSASIGIAFSRTDYTNPDDIMRDADAAMYHAKAHGKARHELFDADMHARALDRLGLESDLRHAVEHTAFELHYQPIVSLNSGRCIGFEGLLRWNREGKPVSPVDFIPLAEELGLIVPLGEWVMKEACRTFADWQRRFPECDLECITVNVSARQLLQQGFINMVEQTVHQSGLKPADLRLEVTETSLIDAPQLVAQVLNDLRKFGVKIYLDDFGTGYSSLSHLHKLPVDALKIDRTFVRGLLLEERPAIVESILALARTLNTGVVAEGVEDERQARQLERLGCRHAQGYFFSRALPLPAVEALLAANQPLDNRQTNIALVSGF